MVIGLYNHGITYDLTHGLTNLSTLFLVTTFILSTLFYQHLFIYIYQFHTPHLNI